MFRNAIVFVSLTFGATNGFAGQLAFDVASIRPSSPQTKSTGILTLPGGRVKVENLTVEQIISEAFDLQGFQVAGAPSWGRTETWDIDAKPPADSASAKSRPASPKAPLNEEQREMLQTLLAERFQLKYHIESREGGVYVLGRGKKKLKLVEPRDMSAFSWIGDPRGGMPQGNGLAGINASMTLLAARLSRYLGRPVIDETGIAGAFDFKVVYTSDSSQPDVMSSIFSSIRELGLTLETAKRPIRTLVIDHAGRASAN